MGLDNGIILISKEKKVPMWLAELRDEKQIKYSLCHWRRCRNIRYEVRTKIFGLSFRDNKNNYLIAEDLNKIIDILKSFNAKNWEHEWMEWRYMKPILRRDIRILRKVRKWLTKHKDYTLYFYDSF